MNQASAIKIFVTFGGIGLIPKAPGTYATLAALPLWWVLAQSLHPIWYMVVTFLFVVLASYLCQIFENQSGEHDSQVIVIDEVAGLLITMAWLPLTWQTAVLGFILFRVFDIFKPGPIGVLDKKVKGGVGVMIDDVAAGLFSNFILQLLYTYTAVLGSQIMIN